tara:strand:+ start:2586 stop:3578 length:993 start_codon:yes stop_codon:yes gene_type:complete
MSEETTNENMTVEVEDDVVDLNEDKNSETVDGYSHLTEEDLNPDYEEPETKETETVETKEEAQPVEDAEPDVSTESDSSEVEEESQEPEKLYNINGANYTADDIARMANDYGNLSSFSGKQAEKIGGYKERIKILEEQIDASNATTSNDEPAEPTSYDIFSEEGISKLANDIADKKVKAFQEEIAQNAAKERYANDVSTAQEQFMKKHSQYKTEEDIVGLIDKGSEMGLTIADLGSQEKIYNYLEHVHAASTGDFSHFSKDKGGAEKPKAKVKKDVNKTVEKVMESNVVEGSLSDVNAEGGDDANDYDKMSFDDWEKLPQSKRNELLGIS